MDDDVMQPLCEGCDNEAMFGRRICDDCGKAKCLMCMGGPGAPTCEECTGSEEEE